MSHVGAALLMRMLYVYMRTWMNPEVDPRINSLNCCPGQHCGQCPAAVPMCFVPAAVLNRSLI